jgi:hypothetical protein
MKTTIITCDICGAPIGMRGGSVDLHSHDAAQTILTTYPPQRAGAYDLCAECCDELAAWIRKRKEDA